MALPVSFRWDEEFVKRIDAARGDVPRSAWVRRAVEQALGGGDRDRSPAPAERPAWVEESPVHFPRGAPVEQPRRGNVGPKRSFTPMPKGGKL